MGAMSATAFSSTPWRRTKGSRARSCGSVRYRQAAPIGAKCSQIVEKFCIRFDDGYRESSENDVVDAEFPALLQCGIDFASEGMCSTAVVGGNGSVERHCSERMAFSFAMHHEESVPLLVGLEDWMGTKRALRGFALGRLLGYCRAPVGVACVQQ